jgi:demethylmenaquinone methyltransferase / 2-methoxy-6-polyprenyl-1,4-benzoquinol methylase
MTNEADGINDSEPSPGALRPPDAVRGMFADITPRYDLLNRALSLGMDILWRREVARLILPAADGPVLDVCCGTGDLSIALARAHPDRGVVGVDFCAPMIDIGRRKIARAGLRRRVELIEGDALALPFADSSFSAAAAAFGIRNVGDLARGVSEMARVVKPGGAVDILEFRRPRGRFMGPLGLFYLRRVVPWTGRLLAGGKTDAYQYLSDSILAFPEPERLMDLMREAGLRDVRTIPLTSGAAALYLGSVPAAG